MQTNKMKKQLFSVCFFLMHKLSESFTVESWLLYQAIHKNK